MARTVRTDLVTSVTGLFCTSRVTASDASLNLSDYESLVECRLINSLTLQTRFLMN